MLLWLYDRIVPYHGETVENPENPIPPRKEFLSHKEATTFYHRRGVLSLCAVKPSRLLLPQLIANIGPSYFYLFVRT